MSSSGAEIRVGIWSRKGEFLGAAEIPSRGGEAASGYVRLSASPHSGVEGMSFIAHRFPGGYRVRMEERWEGGEETLWLAPVEEGEESYMGLFSEEELRAAFPHLAAEHPGGTRVRR
ncbi:hypothetical protein GBA63_19495 [Rubrobacter tropicus]|uniref:Uncharacterized protein n=1 Tax=Rubrobacter tropicus TaxID=2653851 RepID=A0A6G8QEB9_9ACTN|nr:hypothetical protein [Rubrobacter tropicus]QIN84587.1 hypothetical protein GBA63_19495 [Rubrobacter tropicus]